MAQVELKVLGGLPVTIDFYVRPADPSTGNYSRSIEDWEIIEIARRPVKYKDTKWLLRRLEIAGECDIIADHCLESY